VTKEKKKFSRKELKEPDEFQTFWESVFEYVGEHKRPVVLAVSGAVILGVLIAGLISWQRASERAAGALLAQAQSLLKAASPGPEAGGPMSRQVTPAGSSEAREKAAGVLKELVDQHSGSQSAQMGRILLGQLSYEKGDFDDAVKTYQDFFKGRREPAELTGLAWQGLAYAQEAKGEFEQARTSYEKASLSPMSNLQAEGLLGVARCSERLGQNDRALDAYRKFLADQPNNAWAAEAKASMARIADKVAGPASPGPSAPAAPTQAPSEEKKP
jgi:tetratricopeptide (TPR) repeat protein